MKQIDILLVGGRSALRIATSLQNHFRSALSVRLALTAQAELPTSAFLNSPRPQFASLKDLIPKTIPFLERPLTKLHPAERTAQFLGGQTLRYRVLIYASPRFPQLVSSADVLSPVTPIFSRSLSHQDAWAKYDTLRQGRLEGKRIAFSASRIPLAGFEDLDLLRLAKFWNTAKWACPPKLFIEGQQVFQGYEKASKMYEDALAQHKVEIVRNKTPTLQDFDILVLQAGSETPLLAETGIDPKGIQQTLVHSKFDNVLLPCLKTKCDFQNRRQEELAVQNARRIIGGAVLQKADQKLGWFRVQDEEGLALCDGKGMSGRWSKARSLASAVGLLTR